MNRAVFLDRDGVMIQEPPHYIYRQDQLKLIPGTEEAIRSLNHNKFKVVVVSNQAGVAKGYYLEKEVILFNQLMKEELELYSAYVDSIYFCPHHPDARVKKYRTDCDCRKPKPGMLKKAEKEHNIDLKKSFLIGDKNSDILAGKSVGCKTCIVLTGYGNEELEKYEVGYDFIAKDLRDAVEKILEYDNIE